MTVYDGIGKKEIGRLCRKDGVHLVEWTDNPDHHFLGLDGNRDFKYKLLVGGNIGGPDTNAYVYAIPNNTSSGISSYMYSRDYNEGGLHHTLAKNEYTNNWLILRGGWADASYCSGVFDLVVKLDPAIGFNSWLYIGKIRNITPLDYTHHTSYNIVGAKKGMSATNFTSLKLVSSGVITKFYAALIKEDF